MVVRGMPRDSPLLPNLAFPGASVFADDALRVMDVLGSPQPVVVIETVTVDLWGKRQESTTFLFSGNIERN